MPGVNRAIGLYLREKPNLVARQRWIGDY